MGSTRRSARYALSLAAIAVCALAAPAHAQDATPAAAGANAPGDAHRGKQLSYTCLGCHGIDGYKNAYPDYSVPELEGQHPEYLAAALHGYRDGDRSHITMHSQASTLSDQDITDISVYLAGKPLATSGKPPEGTVPQGGALCVSCHGQNGVAIAGIYPSLAGQHEDYLVRAVEEYQKGGRKNPIMKQMAANLKDEDIRAIAHYFSIQRPGLLTEPRPYTRFSAE
jgi:cytochrome c553